MYDPPMDPRYPDSAEAFRQQVRDFFAEQLPANWAGIGALSREEATEFTLTWRKVLFDNGYLGVSWPKEYGGAGLTKIEQVVLAEEFARAGVPAGPYYDGFGIKMVGNTLLKWGTEEQKRHFLPRILSGEDIWCQGYSEPDAGSDLAGLRCQAELDGEEWVINGQKIWTSSAHLASWIFVLVRTDRTAPKHKGITFMVCPMDQPGVEVRPIKMLNGESEFNEVFFNDARTAKQNVVGEVNGGWAVAMTLLGHERGEEAAINPVNFRAEYDRLVELAREYGKTDDPMIRQRLAWCYMKVETMRFLGYRILTSYLKDGTLGREASIAKLYWSEYHKMVTELSMDIMGMHGTVPTGRIPARSIRADDPGAPNTTGSWAGVFLTARAGTIYAGSSEIQRNILGEMLGLPREPR